MFLSFLDFLFFGESSTFQDFEIYRFPVFRDSSDLLDLGIARFPEFVISTDFQDFEIPQFSDFLIAGLVDEYLFWLFEFLGFSLYGFSGFSEIVEFTISRFWYLNGCGVSVFLDFWTPVISWDHLAWLLKCVACWMFGQLVALSSQKSL